MACRLFLAVVLLLLWPLLWTKVALPLPPVLAVWPLPQSYSFDTQPLRLCKDFQIVVNLNGQDPPQDLLEAINRTQYYIENDRHQRLVVGRGIADRERIQSAAMMDALLISLDDQSTVQSVMEEAVKPLGTRDEAYNMSIPSDGSPGTITATSTLGLYRGLTTFSQLWYYLEADVYTVQAPISISDSPAYPYRGFMLDTARNFFPVEDIKRTLDAMSWVKLNVFHWHVVDSQSFPLEVAGFEELSQEGAYSADEVYKKSDVEEIIKYAGSRGIDIIMEIDVPGHSSAIHASHPEHVACHLSKPWSQYANEPPAGQLRLSATSAQFAAALFRAAPSGTMIHTGGDEVNRACYLEESGIDLDRALEGFVRTVHDAVREVGKTPVVWQEMALDHSLKLPSDTIVMVWVSHQYARRVASQGLRIIHAAADYFYLDCGAGGWIVGGLYGNSWCDPFKTWQKAYSFDPLKGLTAAQAHLILGGQQLLWTEQASPENVDSIVWPRAASSAEVFWTGPGGSPREALPRLHDLRYRMVRRGVKAVALQPHWCALRPGACDMGA